jgi:trimethylamine:corrinoid methyltransferase-like protein
LRHFKNEIWSPDVIDRHMFEGWQRGGSKTMGDRCREKVLSILEGHQPDPVLEDNMIVELKRFIAKVEEGNKK